MSVRSLRLRSQIKVDDEARGRTSAELDNPSTAAKEASAKQQRSHDAETENPNQQIRCLPPPPKEWAIFRASGSVA